MTQEGNRLRYGGVLRCTILSLDRKNPKNPKEGDIIKCEWCNQKLVFRDGAWEWLEGSEP